MTDLPPKKAIPYDELLALVYRLEQQINDLAAQLAQHEAAPYPHVRYDMLAIGYIVLDGLAPPDYDIDALVGVPITDVQQAAACELTAEQNLWPAWLDHALDEDVAKQRARAWQNIQAGGAFDLLDDAPDAFERLSAADSELTDEQRARILARVKTETQVKLPDESAEARYPRLPGESYGVWWARAMNGDAA